MPDPDPAALPDVDLPPEAAAPDRPRSPLLRAMFLMGSAGLLAATATDALAVLGRHAGFALLGSIEVVQVMVVLIASSAMIAATIERTHAAVHVITTRLRPEVAARLRRLAASLGIVFFLALAAGSIWIAADLWGGYERTELLGLPLRWFRLVWIAAALTVATLFARQTIGPAR